VIDCRMELPTNTKRLVQPCCPRLGFLARGRVWFWQTVCSRDQRCRAGTRGGPLHSDRELQHPRSHPH
jgi:hypothetical protein